MFLAKTVAVIETQSDSTTAVGQSRGADGDDFCIPYGERNCYLRHKFDKYGMFAVPRRQNIFRGSPAQIPFCEKCSSSTTMPFFRQHLLRVFFFLCWDGSDKERSCMTNKNFEQQLLLKASPDTN